MTHSNSYPLRRIAGACALALALAGLAGCGAMSAQNPSSALKPVNAVEIPPDDRVMLKGADVVAYFTDGRNQQGLPQFKSVFEGVTFHFASAEHKAQFDQKPEAYLPQFGGYCSYGMAMGVLKSTDPKAWQVVDGRLYLTHSPEVEEIWQQDRAGYIAMAEENWPAILYGR